MRLVTTALALTGFASSLASLAACGGGSPPAATQAAAASSPRSTSTSSINPLTGLPRELAVTAFPPAKGEHLCEASEEVIFACTLEGPPPQALTSICLKKGSPRNDPVVAGRERIDGRTGEPFAGQSSHLMITVLEMGDTPFNVEFEQRAEGGAFGVEKQSEPKSPDKPPRYRRNITVGKSDAAKTKHTACDPAHPITDNFEAMRTYKL